MSEKTSWGKVTFVSNTSTFRTLKSLSSLKSGYLGDNVDFLISPSILNSLVYQEKIVAPPFAFGDWNGRALDVGSPEELLKDGLISAPDPNVYDGERYEKDFDLVETNLRSFDFSFFDVISRPWDFSRFIKGNRLLPEDVSQILTAYKKIDPQRFPWIEKLLFRQITVDLDPSKLFNILKKEKAYADLEQHSPPYEELTHQFAKSLFIKIPVTSFDTSWPPMEGVFAVCNHIMQKEGNTILAHVLGEIERTSRKVVEKELVEAGLLRVEQDDVELPLTLALLFDRIGQKKVSASELYDSILKLREDRSTQSFREYLKRFEIAVKNREKENILRCVADLKLAAEKIRTEYSKPKTVETRNWTLLSQFLIDAVFQDFRGLIKNLAKKFVERFPQILSKFRYRAHIQYMTNLGKACVKSKFLKEELPIRLGDIGKSLALEYQIRALHCDMVQDFLRRPDVGGLSRKESS